MWNCSYAVSRRSWRPLSRSLRINWQCPNFLPKRTWSSLGLRACDGSSRLLWPVLDRRLLLYREGSNLGFRNYLLKEIKIIIHEFFSEFCCFEFLHFFPIYKPSSFGEFWGNFWEFLGNLWEVLGKFFGKLSSFSPNFAAIFAAYFAEIREARKSREAWKIFASLRLTTFFDKLKNFW